MSEAFTRPTRSLAGRVAIVSGAGAAADGIGNGRASAILLAEAGCSVVCVDMKEELAARTAEMIKKDGFAEAVAVGGNATVAEDCKNAVQTALSNFGRTSTQMIYLGRSKKRDRKLFADLITSGLDILVNVVGTGGALGTAKEVDMSEWAKSMEINVGSAGKSTTVVQ